MPGRTRTSRAAVGAFFDKGPSVTGHCGTRVAVEEGPRRSATDGQGLLASLKISEPPGTGVRSWLAPPQKTGRLAGRGQQLREEAAIGERIGR